MQTGMVAGRRELRFGGAHGRDLRFALVDFLKALFLELVPLGTHLRRAAPQQCPPSELTLKEAILYLGQHANLLAAHTRHPRELDANRLSPSRSRLGSMNSALACPALRNMMS